MLARDGVVSPPMAMFLASQPYFWNQFDFLIFDGKLGATWTEVVRWIGCQDSDHYGLLDADVCPDPNVLSRLFSRDKDMVVPPVYESFKDRKLNIFSGGVPVDRVKNCGFEACEDTTLSFVYFKRRVLASILMASECISDETKLAPVKALGYKLYIDWTIDPVLHWADERAANGHNFLNAYGIWYTRIKKG